MRRSTANGGSDRPLTMALEMVTVSMALDERFFDSPLPMPLAYAEIGFIDRNEPERKAFMRINPDGLVLWEIEDGS